MTERIDLKALKEAAEKVVAADGGLEASAAIDQFDYLCNAETALRLVAVVEAALRENKLFKDDDHVTSIDATISYSVARDELETALHPFTEST
jgi:hypothetical protein